MNKLLSVIIPAYNEERMILTTASVIHSILENNNIAHELLFVDDGSKDSTWEKISNANLSYVKGVRFSRNFGKEAAIFAGLEQCCGDCCVVIDCDLQHPPQKIVEMYQLWTSGYEVVEAVKSSRGKESIIHKMCAGTFYKIISAATHIDMNRASDFKLLDRKAINALLTLHEKHSFFRALSSWVGFKTTQIEFDVQERTEGTSKWSPWQLTKYAITNITSFSTAPMQIITIFGVISFISSIIIGLISIIQRFHGLAIVTLTSFIALQLFLSSIIMVGIGIVGYYMAKIYEETQNRPKYIITNIHKERRNDEANKTN